MIYRLIFEYSCIALGILLRLQFPIHNHHIDLLCTDAHEADEDTGVNSHWK